MKKRKDYLMVVLTVILLVIGSSSSAFAKTSEVNHPELNYVVLMKLDGVCGESKRTGYSDNWTELTGVDFGVVNAATSVQGAGEKAGKAQMDHFTISKQFDCSSIPLLIDSLSGNHIKNGQLIFLKRSDDGVKMYIYLKIELTDVSIYEYQFDNVYETISLSAGQINFIYPSLDEQGGWDFKENMKR